ncbi:hypothetical protein BGW36DRAFT_376008 [Talaromyces proteolyticus]|uniref:Zn(2)-C6 fungal-type domain-containing protein n=1 Tax=Talaromyces proteolyticus TaxID=1131652 RepID=A0AAD4Q1E9_9EURO|nr:uncharacterized protein BGW36DRAFT_376008 [Talaromyces proteolyticus]KAH8698400.1 hypothetical protein BGW36DRAFT_376008 [Talaromyces proteolyticus]
MQSPDQAPEVCVRCRNQKRKCDKLLPICSLCKRLGHPCHYKSLMVLGKSSAEPITTRSVTLFDADVLTLQDIFEAIYARFKTAIGSESEAGRVASIYFRDFDSCFPIIDSAQFFEQLSSFWYLHQVEFRLLVLSIYLMTAIPEEGELSRKAQSLYIFIKSLIGTLDGIGINSVELIQCRLLMTMFELGHGMCRSAYISVGATVRGAAALKLHDEQLETSLDSSHVLKSRETIARVKWAAQLMDLLASVHTNSPSAFAMIANTEVDDMEARQMMSFGNQFAAVFRSLKILVLAMSHVHDSTARHAYNSARVMELQQVLNALNDVLTQEAETSQLNNVSMALCYSASMILLQNWHHIWNHEDEASEKNSLLFLERSMKEFIHQCRQLAKDAPLNELHGVLIFTAFPIYKAASILNYDSRRIKNLDRLQSIGTMKRALKNISRKWLIGKQYLEKIEEGNT